MISHVGGNYTKMLKWKKRGKRLKFDTSVTDSRRWVGKMKGPWNGSRPGLYSATLLAVFSL